jgi:nucleoid-associated protein YgaU
MPRRRLILAGAGAVIVLLVLSRVVARSAGGADVAVDTTGPGAPSALTSMASPSLALVQGTAASPVARPVLALNPSTVQRGSSIEVIGRGFPAGATVDVYLKQKPSDIVNAVTFVEADTSGEFSGVLVPVPDAFIQLGSFVVQAREQQGSRSAVATATVADAATDVPVAAEASAATPGTTLTGVPERTAQAQLTEQPQPTQQGQATPKPTGDAQPAKATEQSQATEQPQATQQSKATEQPQATQQSKPTQQPQATPQLRATQQSKPTQQAQPTQQSKPTQQPQATPQPQPTQQPRPTEQPQPTPPSEPTQPPEQPQQPSTSEPDPGSDPGSYTVQAGDSLSAIAKRVYDDPNAWKAIYEANRGTIGDNPNLIHPGTELSLPPTDP